MQPLIVDYNDEWPKRFNKLKSKFSERLSHMDIEIEHVGSTAVPGLPSIDIIYKNHEDFKKIKLILEDEAYVYNGNQGIEGREVFKRSGKSYDIILDQIKHHLYVCHFDSNELQRHLLSRNFLLKNEIARNCYRDMKYACAKEANQEKRLYAEIKQNKVNNFINYFIELEKNQISERNNE
jgi:GrpB-like predicted nucleotidyltransferase (UPF0157 family)